MIDLLQRKTSATSLVAAVTAGVLALPFIGSATAAAPASLPFAMTASSSTASSADVDPAIAGILDEHGTALVVIRAADGAFEAAIAAAIAAGAQVETELSLVNGFSAVVSADSLAALAASPAVIAVTANHEAEFHGAENSSAGGDSWFEKTIGANSLIASGIDGSGVGIAIVDSGVGVHPTLAGKVGPGFDATIDNNHLDQHGHGTFLAGLAVGNGESSQGKKFDGVAPGAHIIPVKVGGTSGVKLTDLLEGLQWIHFNKDSHDIDVVNMSFGTASAQATNIDPLNFAVQRLWADGIVVVVSAGNTGAGGASTVTKPGDDPFVITVGSTDSRGTQNINDDTIPAFSAKGPTLSGGLNKPDIVAPGRSLVGPIGPNSVVAGMPEHHVANGWVRASGTSMSAAVVSGAVALLLDAHPDWTPDQVKGALLDSAAPGPVGDPNVDGHGILDVAAAAQVTNPTNYNAGVPFGTGTGSLSGTLGLPAVQPVMVKVNACLYLVCALVQMQIEVESKNIIFYDDLAYVADFAAESWEDTQWQGSQWQGSQWQGSQWQGSQWQGSQWQGSQWQGSQWQGSQWQGSQWQGSQWQGSQWQGSQWQGSQWQGSQWQGSQWQGNDW